jgi:hypothetical protein
VEEKFDMIVLSIGMQTPPELVDLAGKLGIDLTEGNFCKTEHFRTGGHFPEGIYVCGAFQGPKDIPQSVVDSSAAAATAGEILAEGRNTLTKQPKWSRKSTWSANGRDRCFRLPLRHQYRRRGGCPGGGRIRRHPALCGICHRQPVLLLPGHPGHHDPRSSNRKNSTVSWWRPALPKPTSPCSRKP